MIPTKSQSKPPQPTLRGTVDGAGVESPEMNRAAWESGLLEMALQPDHQPQASAASGAPEVPGFEIISLLGTGSSGEVWLAEELEAGRTVALKILRRCGTAGASEEVLQREFRILAKLTHPHLVLLYHGIVTSDGRHGLAMEWIDGWPLDEWLELHPDLTLTEKLELFRGMVRGVAFLHDHGVIHRDLKPANVIVDTQGVAKIVDFGLARLHQEGAATGLDGGSIGVSGTLHFMAPEQAANTHGSRAMPVDVYALGLMLHRILTDEWLRPTGGTPSETLAQVLNPPPFVLRGAGKNLPRDLQSILRQALAPAPAQRYHHARDLEADLNRFAAKQPVSARKHTVFYLATTFVRRQARRTALAGAVVLAGLLAGGVLLHRHRMVVERNEANLRHAYAMTSFTLTKLREELRNAIPDEDKDPLMAAGDFHETVDQEIAALPVNAAGELDLRYFKAQLADLRSAASESRSHYLSALKSIQPALDLYSRLALESPDDPERLLDAAKARLSFARLLGRINRFDDAGTEAHKSLQQFDRLKAWPGFDSAELPSLRWDAMKLVAQQFHHSGDSAGAAKMIEGMMEAWDASLDGPLFGSSDESLSRLSSAASNLAIYAAAAGPSRLPGARLKIQQATRICRAAFDETPASYPRACILARCLHATALVSMNESPPAELGTLFDEMASLLIDTPSESKRTSLPLTWKVAVSATDWATGLRDHPDPAVVSSALTIAQNLTAQVRRCGDMRDEVLLQRARIYLHQSRLNCRLQDRQAGGRNIARAIGLVRRRALREPDNTPLAVLTAATLHHARTLADVPETGWTEACGHHLEDLLIQLAKRTGDLAPEQLRELDFFKTAETARSAPP